MSSRAGWPAVVIGAACRPATLTDSNAEAARIVMILMDGPALADSEASLSGRSSSRQARVCGARRLVARLDFRLIAIASRIPLPSNGPSHEDHHHSHAA